MKLIKRIQLRKQGRCPYIKGRRCIHCEYVLCPGKEGR